MSDEHVFIESKLWERYVPPLLLLPVLRGYGFILSCLPFAASHNLYNTWYLAGTAVVVSSIWEIGLYVKMNELRLRVDEYIIRMCIG